MKRKSKKIVRTGILVGLFILTGYVGYKYGAEIKYMLKNIVKHEKNDFDEFFAQWNVFGIDVSEYQGEIDWEDVKDIFDEHKICFVFIRATAGKDKVDKHFKENWDSEKDSSILRSAYHYYRPNENSLEQAQNFIDNVKLKEGDLPPVLDIEQESSTQSMESLKTGLQKWLDKIETHYGVQPIIYSGSSYYTDFLKKEFKDYKLWVANYNRTKKPIDHDWIIWQYSDHGRAKGIDGYVDINVYDGSYEDLKKMCLE